MTPARKLYLQLVKGTIKSREAIRFVRHLLRQMPGPIFLFWDGNSPHRSKLTRNTLSGFAPRLTVYPLPPYSPELNPDEGVWNQPKCHDLRGFCPSDLDELTSKIRCGANRLRRNSKLIESFFRGCPLFFDNPSSYLREYQ